MEPAFRLARPWESDSTRLGAWMRCRRYFYYAHVLALEPAGEGVEALLFGSAVHAGLEEWLGRLAAGEPEPEALHATLASAWAATESWDEHPELSSGGRSREGLCRLLIWYAEHFGGRADSVRPVVEAGMPLIELPFSVGLHALAESLGLEAHPGHWPKPPRLIGRLDGIVSGPGEGDTWVRDFKSTMQSMSGFYFARFAPSFQFSLYTMVARLVRPALRIRGVLLDAFQVGATWTRFQRVELPAHPEQSRETLVAIAEAFREMEEVGVADGELDPAAYSKRETSCMQGGRPCQFRALCNARPGARGDILEAAYASREVAWDPLARESSLAVSTGK